MNAERNHNQNGGTGSDEDLEGEFADVIGPLRRLGAAIDRATYSGPAWAAPRTAAPRRAWTIRLLLATAAAAAVLVAAAAGFWAARHWPPSSGPSPGPGQNLVAATKPAATPEARPLLPTHIDPSIAAHVTWSLPSISMPSMADPNVAGWSIPQFSFPSFEDLRAPADNDPTSRPEST